MKGNAIVSAAIKCSLLLAASAVSVAAAQDYPSRPIRIVTAEPGGGNDFVARLITPALSTNLGQQVIVENRTGIVSGELVSRAQPDGYTLLMSGSTLWLAALLQPINYDPMRALAPVTQVTSSPNLLVVPPSLPLASVEELVASAKAKPGELNYASATTGSPPHLAAELFKSLAALNIVRINYKGTGPAVTALIGNQVQLMFVPAGSAAPHVKAARLKALAVTTAQPSRLFPGLPTVAATVPGYEVVSMIGIFAPGKTPAPVISRLNREIAQVVQRADIKERFLNAGAETVAGSAEHFAALIKAEVAKWGKVIKEAGIRAE